MKARTVLLLWPVLLVGCISRGSTDLLEARLHRQEDLLIEQQDELTSSKNSIAELRRENDLLHRQLARKGDRTLPPETRMPVCQ